MQTFNLRRVYEFCTNFQRNHTADTTPPITFDQQTSLTNEFGLVTHFHVLLTEKMWTAVVVFAERASAQNDST